MPIRSKLGWIAVAAAAVIRLSASTAPDRFIIIGAVAVFLLGIAAMVMSRAAVIRIAALFLQLVSIVDVATVWHVQELSRTFDARSSAHVSEDVSRIRNEIASIEAQLDASADRIEAQLVALNGEPSRLALFRLLRHEVTTPERGVRVIRGGEVVAWWGQDLRTAGVRVYEFDAKDLCVLRTRAAKGYTVEAFERIVNQPKPSSALHPKDDWVVSSFFHAGYLKQEADAHRYLIANRPDATLYVDFKPRPKRELLDDARGDGIDTSAVLLAAGALAILLIVTRGPTRPNAIPQEMDRITAKPIQSTSVIVTLILIARWALLPLHVDDDPLRIFHFDIYASRILGPFSRSPFDLLLTGAAILGVVLALHKVGNHLPIFVRALVTLAASYGFVLLVRNLVDNSRISSIPDHIIPSSAAQAVLLAALLTFGFALLRL